jgi:hypothetical protein
MFLQDSEDVFGIGTAFRVNGTFLTANHNLGSRRYTRKDIGEIAISDPFAPRILLLLPYGLIYGTTKLPGSTVVTASRVATLLVQADDPIEQLKGHHSMVALDIATLTVTIPPTVSVETLPLPLSGRPAILGEPVLALGYPVLTAKRRRLDASVVTLAEQMRGAFGRVTGYFPWDAGKAILLPYTKSRLIGILV